ncbi:DUF3093 domain-containing protein [Pseudokineococcus basanitobsidens]|uniref:DUF3093 domain-containing protein n=1 Tax=Pseudokineococcus basanitobsidens TaxID=1926649 RepID=A0ABU8RHH9_9ACTN
MGPPHEDAAPSPEPADATAPGGGTGPVEPGEVHRERVLPSAGTWVAAPALAALTGLAVAPLGAGAVVAAVLAVGGVVALLLRLASPLVVVTRDELVAGRAHIPRSLLGAATGYDGEDARRQRGPALDARAFLVMRGWADGVVRVEVLDPDDPAPYWLVSTHRPADLARALQRRPADG